MKTHVIRLESRDDPASIYDKMGWTRSGRILLVWPEDYLAGSRLPGRRLDLALLLRRSLALGAQLALVTRDPEVRFHASQLGIPVFIKVRQAQYSHWRGASYLRQSQLRWRSGRDSEFRQALPSRPDVGIRSRPVAPQPGIFSRTRTAAFLTAVLAMLSIAVLLAPSAHISLQPERQIQQLSLPISVSGEVDRIDLAGRLPWRSQSVSVTGSSQIAVTGTASWPETYATGQVRFTNITAKDILIPVGSKVQTMGPASVHFTITRAGMVGAGIGQTLSLPVKAVLPGDQGNLPAGSLRAVVGPLGAQVTVQNQDATRGGSGRMVPGPGPADYDHLREKLLEELSRQALKQIRANLAAGDYLLDSSLSAGQVRAETYIPARPQPADMLSLTLQVEFTALTIAREDLETLALHALGAVSTTTPASGFVPVPGTLVTSLQLEDFQAGTADVRGTFLARRELQAAYRPERIALAAAGLSPLQAEQRIAALLALEVPPRISMTPSWWPRLPVLAAQIRVEGQP